MGFVTDGKATVKVSCVARVERTARHVALAAALIVVGWFTPGLPGVLLCLAGAMYVASTLIRLSR